MKEKNFKECKIKEKVRKTKVRKYKIKSLIEISNKRILFIRKIKINKENAMFIFENYYISVLELLHALINLKGLKSENHICLSYFLRDALNKNRLHQEFETCRKTRNSLIYYGEEINYYLALECIKKSLNLIKEIKKLF